MKGLSFNVNLSDEQMDHIASLAADKINYTFKKLNLTNEWYDSEIKRLKGSVEKRNEIIVGKEMLIERLKQIIEQQEKEIEELKSR